MLRAVLFLFLTSFTLFAFGQESQSVLKRPASKVKLKSRMRVRSLQNFDDFLHWTLPQHMRSYALAEPQQTSRIEIGFPQAKDFIEWHGFFSAYDPLVGKVSKKKGDLQAARCLLTKIGEKIGDPVALAFATEEVLVKVVAYRDLKIDDQIVVPSGQGGGHLLSYRVDHVFNLWRGMPAFGLIGDQGAAPILLFRGTDFSLDSERGWASLMSDVDLSGPGLTSFTKARPEIRSWLTKVAQRGTKAKVIGFSLGGSLAAYTYLYENDWVSPEGCVAFNPPGLSEQVLEEWNRLAADKRKAFRVYVNRGDIVSKIGKLFGDAHELSLDHALKPLKAHTVFLSAEGEFSQMKIDVDQENLSRRL